MSNFESTPVPAGSWRDTDDVMPCGTCKYSVVYKRGNGSVSKRHCTNTEIVDMHETRTELRNVAFECDIVWASCDYKYFETGEGHLRDFVTNPPASVISI